MNKLNSQLDVDDRTPYKLTELRTLFPYVGIALIWQSVEYGIGACSLRPFVNTWLFVICVRRQL